MVIYKKEKEKEKEKTEEKKEKEKEKSEEIKGNLTLYQSEEEALKLFPDFRRKEIPKEDDKKEEKKEEKIEAKIEKLEYKNNKSFSCCFNLNLKHIKKMNQNCKKEYTHIKDISGLIYKKNDKKTKGNKIIQNSANKGNTNKNYN